MQLHNQPITRDYLDGLMVGLIKTQHESAIRMEKMSLETDREFQELQKELGGIGKSNGAIAKDFFSIALEKKMQVGKLKFDFIDFNLRRKRNNTEA